MKKIFVYVGSPKAERSNTFRYINKLLEKIKKISQKKLDISIFHPGNTEIKRCAGCEKCFEIGKCVLENTDDIGKLKNEMLSSDIIIFGSPIYGANITGDMKIFFDRISSWYHLMALRGKSAMFILTSCGNGVHFTIDFANFIMNFLGLNIMDIYNVSVFYPEQIDKDGKIDEKIINSSNLILEYINGKRKLESSQSLETVFSNLKTYMGMLKNLNSYEYRYWSQNKMLDFENFAKLLEYENSVNVNKQVD